MAGILPFGAVFIELYFIFTAIWENQFYYLFGFLFLVFIILIISCSQISIVMVYFQLCGEVSHQARIYSLKIHKIFFSSGLSLVVAQFHRVRRFGALYSSVLAFLFCNKTGNNRVRADSLVHRLHGTHGVDVLAFDGHHRVLRGVRLHQEDLQCREDRLKAGISGGLFGWMA